MPEWAIYFSRIFFESVLPWTLIAGAVIGFLAVTPLGMALLHHLTAPRRDSELLEMAMEELGALRSAVAELLERQDATEQRLVAERRLPMSTLPPPGLSDVPHSGQVTPH